MATKPRKRTPAALNIELGVTGLKATGGIPREEFLRRLQGPLGVKTYKEMESNDAIVGALLSTIEWLGRQVNWRVDPFDESTESMDRAEFLESCLDDMSMSWSDTLSEIMSMLTYGWSYHEIVYKLRLGPLERDGAQRSKFKDGRIGWRKLPIRSQDTLSKWILDKGGGVQAMVQQPPMSSGLIEDPIEKALLFRVGVHKNNPEGRSIIRRAYRSWYLKKRIEEIEAIGIERDLAGLPVVRAPARYMAPGASTDEKAMYAELKNLVINIRRDEQEGIVLPAEFDKDGKPLFSLELLTTAGARQFDTNAVIQRHASYIAMVALADFILLGHEKVGSFALSDSKTHIFASAMGAILDSIADTFNRHAVPRLFAVNAESLEELPMLVHGDIETPDLEALGQFIERLSRAGMNLTDVETENVVRGIAGLPEAPEDRDDDLELPDPDDPNDDPEEDE